MSISDEEIRAAISETFRVEADEHIQALNRLLLRLEQGVVDDLNACLDEIAREAHTLKGASSILGLVVIQETARALEEVFETFRDAGRAAPPEFFDLLYDALDRLGIWCERVEDPVGEDAAALEGLQSACRRYVAETKAVVALPAPHVTGAPEIVPHVGGAVAEPAVAKPVPSRPRDVADSVREPEAGNEETIRVPIRKLDSLMAQIGELLIARIRNDERLTGIRGLQRELEDATKDWTKLKDVSRHLVHAKGRPERTLTAKRQELLDRIESHLKAIGQRTSALSQDFSRDAMHVSILTDNLQEDIKRARMLPIATILDGFHRLVRDVARREEKQAILELAGTDTEVDKRVLELIKDPLMHILRNAVSHGIETVSERLSHGKPAAGTVVVRTAQVGGQIQIDISDDGRGIDVDRVLDRAIEMGLVEATQGRSLPVREILNFVFHSGLSTKASVTNVSGRGVGMDVVRENIQRVQGQITIDTTPGVGSTITITLPLTLSTTKSLLVGVAGEVYAVPITAVERILRIVPADIESIEDTPALVLDGAPVAVARLADLLGVGDGETPADDVKMPVAILVEQRRLGLVVDSLVDEQEMVVKPLGKQLLRVRNVAGGTVVGSGAVILVLNPLDLISSAVPRASDPGSLARASEQRSSLERYCIMIVEDSITTRTLEKNILETAGYDVVTCKDGAEALGYLRNGTCDAVISDIDMPNVNGFELVEHVRQIERFRDLPILLVTSLGSDEDRRRGMQVGANGYIVKSDFEQGRFLEMLEALL
ncbi:MAG: hybrid sensor histidine kinase/response regulator [Blastocatellia bacterium]|nr:hybrid sensor histidine kinase/response regulator [Blastocatellia bacterium]